MNALIAANATRSYGRGVVTGLGALSSDAVLATIVYLLQALVDLHAVAREVYLLGAVVMAVLGYRLLRRARDAVPARSEATGATYGTAFAVGLSNPFQILWWLTAGLAFAYYGGLLLLLALFAAVAIWVLAFPWAVHVGTRGSARAREGVRYVSGALVLAFAAYFVLLALVG
jgi:threonine/homoserine/homoserine lactone efflux protein